MTWHTFLFPRALGNSFGAALAPFINSIFATLTVFRLANFFRASTPKIMRDKKQMPDWRQPHPFFSTRRSLHCNTCNRGAFLFRQNMPTGMIS